MASPTTQPAPHTIDGKMDVTRKNTTTTASERDVRRTPRTPWRMARRRRHDARQDSTTRDRQLDARQTRDRQHDARQTARRATDSTTRDRQHDVRRTRDGRQGHVTTPKNGTTRDSYNQETTGTMVITTSRSILSSLSQVFSVLLRPVY